MSASLFSEFQYFIKKINLARAGKSPGKNETLEDLEQRFQKQVERGLVIIEPDEQELVMEVLLAHIPEERKLKFIRDVKKTGSCDFEIKKQSQIKVSAKSPNLSEDRDRALDLIIKALKQAGIKVQRQPLGIKMMYAAHELGKFDYHDANDLKLLFVKTIKFSGHVKKADPQELATIFSKLVTQTSLNAHWQMQ